MIENKVEITSENNILCYIIYRGRYYILQPIGKTEKISLLYRSIPLIIKKEPNTDISKFVTKSVTKSVKEIDLSLLVQKIDKINNIKKIHRIIGHLNLKHQEELLRKALKNIIINDKFSSISKKVISFFINNLITNDNIINLSDNELSNQNKKINIIGYQFFNNKNNIYCFRNNNWESCSIKNNRKINFIENKLIIGYIDITAKEERTLFKIRPFENDNINYADKRKIKTGTVCSSINKKDLKKYFELLDLKYDDSYVTGKLCNMLEDELRERQRTSERMGKKVRWFYECEEYQLYKNSLE